MFKFDAIVRRMILALIATLAVYASVAYVVAPLYWRHHEHQTGLAGKSMVTTTSLGIPGDALNVGLEGTREDILCAMRAAGWRGADPVNVKTSVHIAGSVILKRAYGTAPVSPLFYEGRSQDLAFQKPSGVSPTTRHHVRFWKVLDKGDLGQPVWLGAATFDRSVGVSHYTGQITHHVAADIDAERAFVMQDLAATGLVRSTYSVGGVGPTLLAWNGGGDRYFTDGEIEVSRLRTGCEAKEGAPEALPDIAEVTLRKTLFGWGAAAARWIVGWL